MFDREIVVDITFLFMWRKSTILSPKMKVCREVFLEEPEMLKARPEQNLSYGPTFRQWILFICDYLRYWIQNYYTFIMLNWKLCIHTTQ